MNGAAVTIWALVKTGVGTRPRSPDSTSALETGNSRALTGIAFIGKVADKFLNLLEVVLWFTDLLPPAGVGSAVVVERDIKLTADKVALVPVLVGT